jgi:pyruvate formate lyase activating enzyme
MDYPSNFPKRNNEDRKRKEPRMTNIYNITHYTYDNSAYILFKGCNFKCQGCFVKEKKYDYHLHDNLRDSLQSTHCFSKLSLPEFTSIAEKLALRKAVLGGEEPTLDPELPNIVATLSSLGIKTLLTTNGHALNPDLLQKLEEAGLSAIRMSIRAFNDDIHRIYTGQTNSQLLKNFASASKTRIKLIAESIVIPGLVNQNEIARIAEFIADINPAIPYRVDGFMPFNDVPWRSPTPEEVDEAAQTALRHLWFVNVLHCETGHKTREVISIYPTEQ